MGRIVSLIKSDQGVRPAKERGDGRLGGACLSVAYLVLALGVDSIGSPKDREAFLGVGEAVFILACHASFLGHLLLAFPFLWLSGLPQEALEELAVLVEVLDGVGMVGARTLHELVEVVGLALLGLLAIMIGCGDQGWVGRSAPILLVLLAPLHGGALALVLALGLALAPASTKDRSDRLLAGGMVRGDVKQVAGGTGLHIAELVDQGLRGCPREERADDVCINDIRKGVAPL